MEQMLWFGWFRADIIAVFGEQLAVLTSTGLKLLALK